MKHKNDGFKSALSGRKIFLTQSTYARLNKTLVNGENYLLFKKKYGLPYSYKMNFFVKGVKRPNLNNKKFSNIITRNALGNRKIIYNDNVPRSVLSGRRIHLKTATYARANKTLWNGEDYTKTRNKYGPPKFKVKFYIHGIERPYISESTFANLVWHKAHRNSNRYENDKNRLNNLVHNMQRYGEARKYHRLHSIQ